MVLEDLPELGDFLSELETELEKESERFRRRTSLEEKLTKKFEEYHSILDFYFKPQIIVELQLNKKKISYPLVAWVLIETGYVNITCPKCDLGSLKTSKKSKLLPQDYRIPEKDKIKLRPILTEETLQISCSDDNCRYLKERKVGYHVQKPPKKK